MSRYGIKEVFLTLQGEGRRAGTKAVFVRFSGCNLWDGHPLHRDQGSGPCAKWCDTDFFKGTPLDLQSLLARMHEEWRWEGKKRWCVLTGGEPGLQVDDALVDALHEHGWLIAVETNGTVDNPALRRCDYICVAPKRGTDWKALGSAHELKVVLPGAMPGEPGWTDDELGGIEEFVSVFPGPPHGSRPELYVQPQDPIVAPNVVEETLLRRNAEVEADHEEMLTTIFQRHLKRCIDWVHAHPNWRLSLQTHKWIGLQ